jgi:hypothetical protein
VISHRTHPDQCAEAQLIAIDREFAQFSDAGDVNEPLRSLDPILHEVDERRAAGQHLDVLRR